MYANEDYLLQLLKESGTLTEESIEGAKNQRKSGEMLLAALVRQQVLNWKEVAQVCAENANMPFIDLDEYNISPEVVELVPREITTRYHVIPLGMDSGRLVLAITDPLDFETLDSLPHLISHELDFVCASQEQIQTVLTQFYGDSKDISESLSAEFMNAEGEIAESGDDAPIIKLVSQLLLDAFNARASDIHLEPLERTLRVRYRIDGKLQEVDNHPKKLLPSIISRIKIMTGTMSIAEKRIPQDGRIQVKLKDRHLDLRVSTVPTSHGESIVMRILDKKSLLLGLPQLGFFSDDQETFEQLIGLPDGIILVTGPTGSGKTTTLYACLNHINKPDRKIITVEDPVEYQLAGINQVPVKESIGMSFAAALRSILRQAPNIVMIGEIRDMETASIAINASLTGHLVFSTLHTNDAPSAVARLADIGVKPFLVASAVRAIIAQRLVRVLCDDCKAPVEMTEAQMRKLQIDPSQVFKANVMGPVGCSKCNNGGYRGRLGIFEVFKIDDEVRNMINEGLSTPRLRKRAREMGMRTLREDGVRKILAGITSAEEVIRVTMSDAD